LPFVIRDARAGDLDGLEAVARHLDSVNLPNDRARLATLIADSEASFAGRREVADRQFLFVLTEAATGTVLGTSMIFAQHGSRRAPHVYFDVLEEERYSQTLDRHVVHRILRIGYNYTALTEIGGLVLLPELRRHPERLGLLLSAVRFLYLAAHRSIFRDEVLSELMPPLEPDGTSRLWEALGRRFTGLTYGLIRVNGELGAVVMMDGRLFSILSFVTDGQRVCGIYNVRNPDKLGGVALRDLAA